MNTETIQKPVLIVGAFRSGTTFLGRLVDENPEGACFLQPLPLLFVSIKKKFLEETGRLNAANAYYPLNDQQFENYYPPEEFAGWLARRALTEEEVQTALASMENYSGQMFKPERRFDWRMMPGAETLLDFVAAYLAHCDHDTPRSFRALKETTGVEEYIPYWLANGGKVIQIVRHPLDVARSLSLGGYGEHVGARRPLLWIARNWRKSALHALAHRDHPDFHLVRFEDLVSKTAETAKAIRAFLGLPENQAGEQRIDWTPNTSRTPDARAEPALGDDVERLLESWCHFEMAALGMKTALTENAIRERLAAAPTMDFDERPQLAHYRYAGPRRDEEIARHAGLAGENRRFVPQHVVFREAYEALLLSRR